MPRNKEFDYDEKLVAARDLFWKKGYNATTINDLVDTMQINRSSLYLAYGNKHDLFIKSLINYIQKKDKQYSEAAMKSDKPLDAICNVIYSVMEAALKETNCLFTNSVFELATTDKKVKDILKRQNLKAIDFFELLLKQAQSDGSLPLDKDARALAFFLISGLVSVYNTHIVFGDSKLTRQTAQILISVIRP
jgi:TetR/AcrR family transcriptional repressor of nem operon